MQNNNKIASENNNGVFFSRREFIKSLAVGGSALFIADNFKLLGFSSDETGKFKAIVVDYSKCAGCRTCEMVCSAANNKIKFEGQEVWGLGNPVLANIKVHNYNPDIDVPIVCALCQDSPCINACPVEPDSQGRKALYKHPETGAVTHNPKLCTECEACADVCREQRTACIIPDKTGRPTGICSLCNGDPECVKNCPYDAIQYLEVNVKRNYFGWPPDKIAAELTKKLYTVEKTGGVK